MIFQILSLIELLLWDTVQDITLQKEVRYLKNLLLIALAPSPSSYNLKSEFTSAPTNKAWSFGIAREAYSKVYIKESPPIDKNIPGPG